MRTTIFFLLLVVTALSAEGQFVKKFYDRNDKACDSAQSYYYRLERKKTRVVVDQSDKKSHLDTVFTYYTATAKTRTQELFRNDIRNGNFISYFENGEIRDKGNYANGVLIGYFLSWYPSGLPHQTVEYNDKMKNHQPNVINYWDSLGRQLVTNGNGVCKCYSIMTRGRILREDGKVVGGWKDSIWTAYTNDTLSYKERYKDGEFLSGVRYYRSREYPYEQIEEQPQYPGGAQEMLKFIKKNTRYPKKAQHSGAEGKIFVAFVVNKDGTLSNIEILKGVTYELEQEALRVVSLMEKWTPGKQRGLLVRVKFVLPINFSLRGR